MGQQVAVTEKPSPRPGLLRLETNRSLTGMGHERFTSMHDAVGPRPAAMLARRLLSTGKVDSVYMYGNIISVDIAKGFTGDGLADVVRNMYQFWKPGMEMPTFDAPADEAAPAAAATPTVGARSSRRTPSWCRSPCANAAPRHSPSGSPRLNHPPGPWSKGQRCSRRSPAGRYKSVKNRAPSAHRVIVFLAIALVGVAVYFLVRPRHGGPGVLGRRRWCDARLRIRRRISPRSPSHRVDGDPGRAGLLPGR